MTSYTYALPAAPVARNWTNDLLQIMGASILIALCAQIRIPLYFTPVPLSGQVFAVMLIGALLGSRKGALAVLAYMVEGTVGLPVFNGGGAGILHLLGPTGGYLLGFAAQAYLTGSIKAMKEATSSKILTVLLLSCAVQLGIGTAWLTMSWGMSLYAAFIAGFAPFIFGDLVKCVAVTAYLKFSAKA